MFINAPELDRIVASSSKITYCTSWGTAILIGQFNLPFYDHGMNSLKLTVPVYRPALYLFVTVFSFCMCAGVSGDERRQEYVYPPTAPIALIREQLPWSFHNGVLFDMSLLC